MTLRHEPEKLELHEHLAELSPSQLQRLLDEVVDHDKAGLPMLGNAYNCRIATVAIDADAAKQTTGESGSGH